MKVVVQSLSHVRLFSTPWTAAHQPAFPILILIKLLLQHCEQKFGRTSGVITRHVLMLLPISKTILTSQGILKL